MPVYTRAGQINDEGWKESEPPCVAHLFNFDIGHATLKPDHKAWLDEHVVTLLETKEWLISLTGTASRSGNQAFNLRLSQQRAMQVEHYLRHKVKQRGKAKILGADRITHAWYGSDRSNPHSLEDGADRAVALLAEPNGLPFGDQFEFRMLRELGTNEGTDDPDSAFDIRDVKNHLSAIHYFQPLDDVTLPFLPAKYEHGGGKWSPVQSTPGLMTIGRFDQCRANLINRKQTLPDGTPLFDLVIMNFYCRIKGQETRIDTWTFGPIFGVPGYELPKTRLWEGFIPGTLHLVEQLLARVW
jgi:hypothetical protein